jgi:putative DNA primase/helicase
VSSWKEWIVYDGKRWKIDGSGEIYRLAMKSVQAMREVASQLDSKQDREALWEHAKKSDSRARLEAKVSLAQKVLPLPIEHEQLNRDAWLFNFNNGTMELRTGCLREHRRDDYITKITPFDYPTEPVEPWRFLQFLDEIFDGDVELIAFFQRLIGQALIGEQRDHILPIFYGAGANGKSTLIGTLVAAFGGDYGITLNQDYLIQSKQPRHSTEIMDLYQMRLAVASETDEGARLNEARVKQQTGGGKLRGRKLHRESWEYEQSHTLIVETNHKPRITGTDEGIWRRVLLIPFDIQIPPECWDLDLSRKLRAEIPAILRWAVEGCGEYLRMGLSPPERVIAATSKYRDESDLFGIFVNEHCELGKDFRVRGKELYERYAEHARQRGEFPIAHKRVEERLENMGVLKRHTDKGNFYFGLRLKPPL